MKFKFTNLLNGVQEVLKIKRSYYQLRKNSKFSFKNFAFQANYIDRYLLY